MARAPRPARRAGRVRWVGPVVGCLAATAAVLAVGPGSGAAPVERPATQAEVEEDPLVDADLVAAGKALYDTSCVSCHGDDGQGIDAPGGGIRGPSLEDAGSAGAYFQVSTGRMPLANPDETPSRKEPAFDDDEIAALTAYVATFGDGPVLPVVDTDDGDLAEGGVLYRENCQACHSATGAGGALSYGRAAPALASSTPEQIGGAVRSGPGPMPRFGPEILDEQELNSVARYIEYLEEPDDRGGLALGRLGPIPEGFMIWVGGLGALLVAAWWMGKRFSHLPRVDPIPPGEAMAATPTATSTEPAAAEPDDDPPAEDET